MNTIDSSPRDSAASTPLAGTTTVADLVVTKIAGIATREVAGVHRLGDTASRAVGAVRSRIPGAGANLSQGVSVTVGQQHAAVDLDLVATYGMSLADLAAEARRTVRSAIEAMTGLAVTEVNVTIHDVHVPEQPRIITEGQ